MNLYSGDVLKGYSSTRITDDLSYYDDQPHVVVNDQYYVEPSQTDLFWQSAPAGTSSAANIDDHGYHSASLQVHVNERF